MITTADPTVIYESEHILGIDKPAGMIVHADGTTKERPLTEWLLYHYPEINGVGEPFVARTGELIQRPGIVHRLDSDTSGVLLVARTHHGFEHLKSEFKKRNVHKLYYAFVYGTPKRAKGIINRAIGKSAKDFRLWSAQRGAKGKLREAVTRYEIMRAGSGVSFVALMPETGRTHQLRVHMKAIDHPIVSDPLYAPRKEPVAGFERLALHASEISFTDPEGERVTVTAPFPPDFKEALEHFLPA